MRGIKSGYGNNTLPLWAVFNLYVIFIITSLPGLAISPIMGDLQKIFPGTSQLETQFLTLGPNIAAIPFVFIGGWIGTKFNNMKLLNWSCLLYGIGGALFFVAPNMITLILLSFLIGITAGIVSPLSTAFIADLFGGSKRTEQYGYTSAVLNGVLMISVLSCQNLVAPALHNLSSSVRSAVFCREVQEVYQGAAGYPKERRQQGRRAQGAL